MHHRTEAILSDMKILQSSLYLKKICITSSSYGVQILFSFIINEYDNGGDGFCIDVFCYIKRKVRLFMLVRITTTNTHNDKDLGKQSAIQ